MANPKCSIEHVHTDTSFAYTRQELERFAEVDQGDFQFGESSMISDGFYNCVALIGLSKNIGLLGHFQRIDTPDLGSNKQFSEAIRVLAETNTHTVILAGAHLFDNPVDLDLATRDRAFAEKAVRSALPDSELVLNWNEKHRGRQDIIVHPRSGRVVIHNVASNFEV